MNFNELKKPQTRRGQGQSHSSGPIRVYGQDCEKNITKGKYRDIQELLKFVPPIYHPFYNNLTYKE